MTIESRLQSAISKAFKALFEADLPETEVSLQPTRKDFEGTHTFVTFPYARMSRKNPEETGRMIGEYLKENQGDVVAGYNVVKGFLNIELQAAVWTDLLAGMYTNESYGQLPANGDTVMVEYSSPNTNKPLHLGHLRNNFLGFSVSRILQQAGYDVVKANLVNDRGIHICKSMLAYQKFGDGETPESAGMKGDHLIGKYYVIFDKEYRKEIARLTEQGMEEEKAKKEAPLMQEAQEMLRSWELGDEETLTLWKKMNSWVLDGFEKTYERMGVDFDKFYFESDTYLLGKDIVEEGLSKGVFYKKDDGSVWCDLTEEGLDNKLVLRSDGTSVYMTQDMGTADLKYNDFGMKKSLYVVGNEQDYHFKVLFAILDKLDRPYAKGLYHLSYGMVDLPSGRMKSREGTVVDADDLMTEMVNTAAEYTRDSEKIKDFTDEQEQQLHETVAMSALKFYLLKVDPKKRMLFNPEESIDFHGHTGPFIQYTYARTAALGRKAAQVGLTPDADSLRTYSQLQPAEQEVIRLLTLFPDKVKEAAAEYSPATIAQYVYDLAKEYNRFYSELSIFQADDEKVRAFRIALTTLTGSVIKKSMSLLGISVPEKM